MWRGFPLRAGAYRFTVKHGERSRKKEREEPRGATAPLGTRRDDGASAVEYGLLVALIAVVIAGAVALLGTTLRDTVNDSLPGGQRQRRLRGTGPGEPVAAVRRRATRRRRDRRRGMTAASSVEYALLVGFIAAVAAAAIFALGQLVVELVRSGEDAFG